MGASMLKKLLILGAFAALAGCDGNGGFNAEAGAGVDEGGFGNPTMNNQLMMTDQRAFAMDLTRRFLRDVPATVNFAFNSARLDGQARANLRRQADWIRQFPEVRLRVYGHTDLVGSNAYNRRLGKRRANAVVAYLTTLGISPKRLEAVASFGETRPLIFSPGPERENRRTVTEVAGFVQRHPTVLNGKYAEVIFRDYVTSAQEASTLSGTSGDQFRTEE